MGKRRHGLNILAGLFGGLGDAASEYVRLKEKKGDKESDLLQSLSELSMKHQLGLMDPYKQALTSQAQASTQESLARAAMVGKYAPGQSPQEVLDLYGKKKELDLKYAKPDKPLMSFGDFLKAKDEGRFKFGKLAMPLPPIGELFREYRKTVGGRLTRDDFSPTEVAKIAEESGLTIEQVYQQLTEEEAQ